MRTWLFVASVCVGCAARPPVAPSSPVTPAFRWIVDTVGKREALVTCPADGGDCVQLARYEREHPGDAVISPSGNVIAVQRIDAEGRCSLELYDHDARLGASGEHGCNANNGDLVWIDDDHLWAAYGAGTNVSCAQLVTAGSTEVWSTCDLGVELAPSGRYALVATNSHGGTSIDRVTLLELAAADTPIASIEVHGDDVHARWERDRVVVGWAGGVPSGTAIEAPGARSLPERADLIATWRPFAGSR